MSNREMEKIMGIETCHGNTLSFAGEDPRFLGPESKPQYAPHRDFQPTHVKLELRVDVKKKYAQGVCTTQVELFGKPEKITFNAEQMTISSIEVNGKKVKFEYDKSNITIPVINTPTKSTVRIAYETKNPPMGIFFIHPTKYHPHKPYQAWSHSQTNFARYWYPCQDQPESKSTIEQHITVENPFRVVSNGVLVGTKPLRDKKWTTYSWKFDSPNSSYLNSFAIGDFGVVKDKWKHVSVEYYCDKGKEEDIQRSFGNTPKMLDFFSRFTGYDYPHKKYAQVAAQEFIYGGMEHTTCTTQSDRALQDEIAHNEYWYYPELLAAHELAHQWFGDLLTCNDWMHGWLNESFATYFEAMWTEEYKGKDEFAYEMYSNAQTYLDEDKNRYRRPIVSNVYTQPEDVFDRHLYEKGALILHTIRFILGNDGFQKSIQHYVKTHAHTAVQTEDLIESIREATGKNLTRFFDQWIYNTGYPELKVNAYYDAKNKKANVRVVQTTKIDDKSLFQFPVNVAITFPNQKIQVERVEITKREQRFSFPVKGEPYNIVFDPENVILKSLAMQKPRKMWVYQLTNDPHSVQRIFAAQEIGKNPSADEWNTLQHALAHDAFWGVRGQTALIVGNIRHPNAEQMLHKAYHTETNKRALRGIVQALGNFQSSETIHVLKLATERKDSYIVPSEAYTSLGKRKSAGDLAYLKKGMEKKSWVDIIPTGVVRGIAAHQTRDALQLILHFTEPNYSYSIRKAAINALRDIGVGKEKVVPRLIELLKDPSINLQIAAATVLGTLGDERTISHLEKLKTGHRDGRLKRQALESIRQINGGQDLPPYAEGKK